jgi:hypothetical protein
LRWNSTTTSNGPHTLYAYAYSPLCGWCDVATRSISVQNPATSTPTATQTHTPTATPTDTATPIPPTPTPTPWRPSRTLREARVVQQSIFQVLADAGIWIGVICLPFLGLGALVWLAWRKSRRRSARSGP